MFQFHYSLCQWYDGGDSYQCSVQLEQQPLLLHKHYDNCDLKVEIFYSSEACGMFNIHNYVQLQASETKEKEQIISELLLRWFDYWRKLNS